MPQTIYDTVSLVGLVPNLMTSQNFILDRFFPNIVTSDDAVSYTHLTLPTTPYV